MRTVRILLLIMIPVLVCLAAGPITPVTGIWVGEGKGNVHPPGTTIYPWQHWKGEVPNSGDTFSGAWKDEDGNCGKFKGKIDWISLTVAVAKGYWTWDHPDVVTPIAGKFKMFFHPYELKCKGEWDSIYPSTSAVGIMWGKKVE